MSTMSGRPRRGSSPSSPPGTRQHDRPGRSAALADFFTFTDFAHFIEIYQAVVALIRTTDDLHLLTYEIARELAAQQVRYVELQVTPYTHFLAGIRRRRSAPSSRTYGSRPNASSAWS